MAGGPMKIGAIAEGGAGAEGLIGWAWIIALERLHE
jgi:hypothetical protein